MERAPSHFPEWSQCRACSSILPENIIQRDVRTLRLVEVHTRHDPPQSRPRSDEGEGCQKIPEGNGAGGGEHSSTRPSHSRSSDVVVHYQTLFLFVIASKYARAWTTCRNRSRMSSYIVADSSICFHPRYRTVTTRSTTNIAVMASQKGRTLIPPKTAKDHTIDPKYRNVTMMPRNVSACRPQ